MSAPILLGFDIGTTHLKAGIYNHMGRLLGHAKRPTPTAWPRPGWAEMDADAIWEKFLETLDAATAAAAVSPHDIGGIAFSAICPAMVPMDSKGHPLRNAIYYADCRSYAEADSLQETIRSRGLTAICANRIASGASSVSSILWIKKNEPDVWDETCVFGHIQTSLAARLTGEFGMDRTNASLTGLLELARPEMWSESLCGCAGIAHERLPKLCWSYECLGTVSEEAAKLTGLRTGTPVALGAADTVCSAVAVGFAEGNSLLLSSGTADVPTACTNEPRFDQRLMNRCYVAEGLWLIHGAMSTTGAALEWFFDKFYVPGHENTQEIRDLMTTEAAAAPPGSHGVVFLPYLHGERTPVWDPHAKGVFFGLSFDAKRPELARAVMEGCAYGTRQLVEITEEVLGTKFDNILLLGGGANNRLWRQIKADVLQLDVIAYPGEDTATRGAAMLAAVAAGFFTDWRAAAQSMGIKPSTTISPDPRLAQVYERPFDIYKRLYPALRELF